MSILTWAKLEGLRLVSVQAINASRFIEGSVCQGLPDMYDIDALAVHDASAHVRCAQCNILRDRAKHMHCTTICPRGTDRELSKLLRKLSLAFLGQWAITL